MQGISITEATLMELGSIVNGHESVNMIYAICYRFLLKESP